MSDWIKNLAATYSGMNQQPVEEAKKEEAKEEIDTSNLVCKDCGDEFGKPHSKDCPHDCKDPEGKNWVTKTDDNEDEDGPVSEKTVCPQCEGKGCDHCDNTGYHDDEEVDEKALKKNFGSAVDAKKFDVYKKFVKKNNVDEPTVRMCIDNPDDAECKRMMKDKNVAQAVKLRMAAMKEEVEMEEETISEKYQRSLGFNTVDKMMAGLEKALTSKSALAKGLSKGMGPGYAKDFDKMGKLFGQILDIWDQINMDVDMQESVNEGSCSSGKKTRKEDNTNDVEDDGEGLDKVQPKALKKKFKDRKDKDIDNDGDVDGSDEYLHNRRKTVAKAIAKESKEEDLDEGFLETLAMIWVAKKMIPLIIGGALVVGAGGAMGAAKLLGGVAALKKAFADKKVKDFIKKNKGKPIDAEMKAEIDKLFPDSVKAKIRKEIEAKGGDIKEEVELDEKAPKMKDDFLKKERERNRKHDSAMGRTATGRKKPASRVSSTKKSLAAIRAKEGNAFTGALMAARKKGDSTFVVGGKTYKCEDYEFEESLKDTNRLLKMVEQSKEGPQDETRDTYEKQLDQRAYLNPGEKEFVQTHNPEVPEFADVTKVVPKTFNDFLSAVKPGPGRPNDNKAGDKTVINPPKEEK